MGISSIQEERVHKNANGLYTWRCRIDPAYYRKSLRMGLYACLLIAILLPAIGLYFSFIVHDLSSVLPVLLADRIFIGIVAAIFIPLFRVVKEPWEVYVMNEEFIRSGSGRSSVYFDFKRTKEVLMSDRYIELIGRFKHFRLYYPMDDKDMIRGFINRHIPLETIVRYDEKGY